MRQVNDEPPTPNRLQSLTGVLRLCGPLATHPTARILHVLVLSVAIWSALWSAILIPLYPNVAARVDIAVLRELGPVAALVLLRRGLFRPAAIAYLGGNWVATTVSLTLNGGIHSPFQISYVTLPILATWLLGYRAALWTAGACLGSALIFAILEGAGVNFTRITSVTPLAIWVMLIQVVLIGAVPVAQILRTLSETLAESRRTQQELQ